MRPTAVWALLAVAAVVAVACGDGSGSPAASGSTPDYRTATPTIDSIAPELEPSTFARFFQTPGPFEGFVPDALIAKAAPMPSPEMPRFAETPLQAAEEPNQVGEAELRQILQAAGWEPGLVDAGLRLAWCESRWHPGSISSGGHRGLFQLEPGTWARYAGVSVDALLDPMVNARVAWLLVLYDRAHGYPDFAQWQCQP